jgi:divalent metal cation (Fe/Co/Zn/Cd) transporter
VGLIAVALGQPWGDPVAGLVVTARARCTGRTLRVEIEGWVDPELPARDADVIGRLVAGKLSRQLPEAGSFTWTTRAAPA